MSRWYLLRILRTPSSSRGWSLVLFVGLLPLVACSGEDDGTGGNGSGVGSGNKGGGAGTGSLGIGGRAGAPIAGTGGAAGMVVAPPIVCGDGKIEGGEICDDGNLVTGDGCSAGCVVEPGYFCSKLGGKPCLREIVCGDGRRDEGEACDDGNLTGSDGCSVGCRVERGFTCVTPGTKCIAIDVPMACGNGLREGLELCDDGNTMAGDGCDASCQLESGFRCPTNGAPCVSLCGDGVRRANEQCDDGNLNSGDGCDLACRREPGFACDLGTGQCKKSVCGDKVKEGDEGCDDGNVLAFDGCSPTCQLEPKCGDTGALEKNPACAVQIGDGLVVAGEACDDGNDRSGDGCSNAGAIEPGFTCPATTGSELRFTRVLRDFSVSGTIVDGKDRGHPDFFGGNAGHESPPGVIDPLLSAAGHPRLPATATASPISITSAESFSQWYVDDPARTVRYDDPFVLSLADVNGSPAYQSLEPLFFPLDTRGWMEVQEDESKKLRNYYFTSETRLWLRFEGSGKERVEFEGDDDVYVFLGGHKLIDLGGIHGPQKGTATFSENPSVPGKFTASWEHGDLPVMPFPVPNFELVAGQAYELRIFHAERQPYESSYQLTLAGFEAPRSKCTSLCGDGIVSGDEICDTTMPDKTLAALCREDCLGLRPFCGDGKIDFVKGEVCDDGGDNGKPGKCSLSCGSGGTFCGDGQTDAGEECDDGSNPAGGYGACLVSCKRGPRCGDGIVNGTEQCDDGNTANGDGCTVGCHDEKL